MKEQRWERRERKWRKRRYGMRVDGASTRDIPRIQAERAKKEKP